MSWEVGKEGEEKWCEWRGRPWGKGVGEEGTELKGIGMLLWCRGGGGETDVPFKVLLPVCNIINVNNRNNIKTLGKKNKNYWTNFQKV